MFEDRIVKNREFEESEGASIVEYALIIALLSALVIAAMSNLQAATVAQFQDTSNML